MIQIKKLKNHFIAALISFVLLFTAMPVFAAEIFYDSTVKEVRADTAFEIGVFLNAEKENINAVEGILQFPFDLLEFKKISDGNSIINFWVERPGLRGENQIIFSGIIPGGFLGKRGLIFTVIFSAKKEGAGKVEMREIKALRNDGEGTTADISTFPLEIAITKEALSLPPKEEKDKEPPESFVPEIARSPTLFDGKYFLVFATQDKKSGIDHYEVREGGRRFVTAESPYLLQNQNLDEKIIVKAVDKNGNERIASVPAQNPRPWYKDYAILAILIVAALAYIIWKLLWKRHKT